MVIISSSSIYLLVYQEINSYLKIALIGICFLTALFFYKNNISLKCIVYILLLFFIFMLNLFLFQVNAFNVLMVFLRFVSLIVFVFALKRNNISITDKIFNILFLLATIYLFFYIIFDLNLFGVQGEKLVVKTFSGVQQEDYSLIITSYYNIFYRVQTINIGGNVFNRLNGFCTEAGAYQFFINLCLIWVLFYEKKISFFKVLILVLSIVFTFSTMGYICMFIIIFARVLKSKNIFLSVFSFVIAITFIIITIKLLEEKTQNLSYSSRTEDLGIVFNYILESPLVGYGLGEDVHSYSGLLTMFYNFGLTALVFITPMFFATYKVQDNGKLSILVFAICIVLGFINEPFEYSNFMFLLSGIGLSNILFFNNEVNLCQTSL